MALIVSHRMGNAELQAYRHWLVGKLDAVYAQFPGTGNEALHDKWCDRFNAWYHRYEWAENLLVDRGEVLEDLRYTVAITKAREHMLDDMLNRVFCEDAISLMARLPDASISLLVIDWPYNGVKDDEWDNQWATDNDYLTWMKAHLVEMRRILKPNGSYYGFASPRMAARVEVLTGEVFNVINRITWRKPEYSTKAEMFDKDSMRGFFPASEAIIFAEQYGSDEIASGEAGFVAAEEALKRRIFGDYLSNEFNRAKVTNREIATLFPSITGGLTGCVSNWIQGANVPTSDQYRIMREYLNQSGGEYLRREYEYLRRPFNVSANVPYTDVWDFPTVSSYPGKHPCEKPLAMMRHIVNASSRPGDIVADFFCGSGNTLLAAAQSERGYIGCDRDTNWSHIARERLKTEFGSRKQKAGDTLADLPLFSLHNG